MQCRTGDIKDVATFGLKCGTIRNVEFLPPSATIVEGEIMSTTKRKCNQLSLLDKVQERL
jgi:hypothetical protein